ncbi:MAG: hypothetical protein PHW63_03680 [Alphaproteobacteria bacterium]|nr:hypothetical protein [Alphaproteobacteria bacterium]
MDKQEVDSLTIERMVHNAIAVDGVDFRRSNREILAGYLRDEGGHEKLVETTFAFIDTHKENADPLIRERAHKTEAAIYAAVPFILQPHDITYLWLDAAQETDGSVRAAIQSTMGTIIDKRFDLVTPETVKEITKTVITEDRWNARILVGQNLDLVLRKEESRGRIVSVSPVLAMFRQAMGHTHPEVRKNVINGCDCLVPFAGPEHMNTLAALIVGPAIFDDEPDVRRCGQQATEDAIYKNPSMVMPIARYIKEREAAAARSPQTVIELSRTKKACRNGMAALTDALFPK